MFKGSIDVIENGVVLGWAVDLNNQEPLAIVVVAGEQRLGVGLADKFRKDLKEAGIHEGNHAFQIDICELWGDGEELVLSLVESKTNELIANSTFKVPSTTPIISAKQVNFQRGVLSLYLSSNIAFGKRSIIIWDNEKPLVEFPIDSKELELLVDIQLPVTLLDGNRRLIKVGLQGYPNIICSQIIECQPIQTPWQYLNNSYRQPGMMSLPKQAGHRYETLEFQMKAIADGESQLSVGQLSLLHNVLVESYEGRKVFPKFSLPKFQQPMVSIIVPAYNLFELTYHAIASIVFAFNKTSYEVILADDCSTDETAEAEDIIDNLVVSRNAENLRFLKSCNQAADLAKGKYIVFLNNDTEVTSYWLDELVNIMEKDESVGMTGSKLLNLDGSLQEAGGIVWGNGMPWNVGRNANPQAPEYNYVRQVDYLTGAAMCIRTDVWLQVDKFSEELAPCYFEDTDLAFKVRQAGFKTLYTPFSQVVHFEGQSHGTDVTQGLKKNQVINQKVFGKKWFKAFRLNGVEGIENSKTVKDRNINHRILVIDYATPELNKDAGGYAAIQEIKLLISLGFKVTFVPENLAFFGKHTKALQAMGVEVLYAPFYISVPDVIQKRVKEMDAVYITRYSVAEKYIDLIKQHSNCKILFNNADLHFLRELRSALKNGRDEVKLQGAIQTRSAELDVCQKVDAILCYNTTEHAVIASHILETEKLHLTPWVLENKSAGPSFEQRQGIAFLGGFNHFPNVECVEFLADKVMPMLAEQRPDICLYVYGSNMPDTFSEFETDNMKLVGYAEHLDEVYHNHRVFVAPLHSGAGIKGKILEAMAYNVPCVLSDVAAEGTGLTHGISALIANKADDVVQSIIKLYDNAELWAKISSNEAIIVESSFSFEFGKRKFQDILASVDIFTD